MLYSELRKRVAQYHTNTESLFNNLSAEINAITRYLQHIERTVLTAEADPNPNLTIEGFREFIGYDHPILTPRFIPPEKMSPGEQLLADWGHNHALQYALQAYIIPPFTK